MSMQVLAPGLLSTLQDGGRRGYRALGVGSCGAADGYSLQIANRLVGNPPAAAALEITLAGPRLHVLRATRIALCGGRIDAHCDGIALPGWRPILLPAGAELQLGAVRQGCRSYLAVAGGFDAPVVLGSRSTDLRGGFGGWHGRALQAGDVIGFGPAALPVADIGMPMLARWSIDPRPDLVFDAAARLRVLPGIDATEPNEALFATEWTVEAASNRQGLRLRGTPLSAAAADDQLSSPVVPGILQLPPDGQPILLLADAQTVGGYPRIGQLAQVDLPRAAQLRPGDPVRFEAITSAAAAALLIARRQRLARIDLAIAARQADPYLPVARSEESP